MRFRYFLLAAALALQPVAAQDLPDLGEESRAEFSPQTEARLGEEIMREIRTRDPSYLEDAEISGYLASLGARLGPRSGDRQVRDFFAVRDASLNAFALPGGYIGVHTGLLLAAQSESELAAVLAHEAAHVHQNHISRLLGRQKQVGLATLGAILVAVLAARSSPDAAQAALLGGQAAGMQAQLAYSRDFEREADRIGLQFLENGGFDVRGMAVFMERMQRFSRLYETGAPGYLRSHPLTAERISDIENRVLLQPLKKVEDSLDFRLVRAKLRADHGAVQDARTDFEAALADPAVGEAAARYGLARVALRAGDAATGLKHLEALRSLKAASPLIEGLAADLRAKQGDTEAAIGVVAAALSRYPGNAALQQRKVDLLLGARRFADAQRAAEAAVREHPREPRFHARQAEAWLGLGKRLASHRAQAEAYVLQGYLQAAIEQLELAQRARDGSFQELSAVDARLHELRDRRRQEEMEMRRRRGG